LRSGTEWVSKGVENGSEILCPLFCFVNMSTRAMGRWATSVDDTTDFVNKITVVDVATVSKCTQFGFVVESVGIIGRIQLHLLGPEKQTSNPLEIRMFYAVANLVRGSAKVNVREEG